ncbi:MAG: adenosylmethionine-8-amino-7-oxononanoate aminotransferase [Granulosicoccus sp.]|jgi:adenosylmethionine-8-amino-7-oxononanoate aminotransferase
MSNQKSLSERDREAVWHPFTAVRQDTLNIGLKGGEGSYLIAENGERYLDAIGSWWVNLHGHAHPDISKAVADQASKLEHAIFAGFTHEGAVELAERLLKHMPEDHSHIFYSDNGSTAVEVGIKLAIQYWYNQGENRKRIIAIDGSYHGDTFGAMSVGERGVFTQPFDSYLFEVDFIDFPEQGLEEKVFEQFSALCEKGDVAAFVFEPLVQGTAGMRVYSSKLLDRMMAKCKELGIITIADEVMTGFGRTGTFLAVDQIKNKPDLIALSKGLTGGYLAMGATSCASFLREAFWEENAGQYPERRRFLHGHSYTGNPLACAAGLASLDLTEDSSTQENIDRISDGHSNFKIDFSGLKGVKEIRHKGVILAVEFESGNGEGYFDSLRERLYDHFIERKILMRPLGNVAYILPPYCITNEELKMCYDAIIEFSEKM